jgi:hypothetical protein
LASHAEVVRRSAGGLYTPAAAERAARGVQRQVRQQPHKSRCRSRDEHWSRANARTSHRAVYPNKINATAKDTAVPKSSTSRIVSTVRAGTRGDLG